MTTKELNERALREAQVRYETQRRVVCYHAGFVSVCERCQPLDVRHPLEAARKAIAKATNA